MTWGNENMERMTTIIMNTSEGSITINLFDDKAPNTVSQLPGPPPPARRNGGPVHRPAFPRQVSTTA